MRTGTELRDGFLILVACAVFIAGLVWVRSVEAGNFPGEQPAYARETGQDLRLFYVAAGNGVGAVEYICSCFPGTTGCGTTSSSVWQVKRFTYDSSNRLTQIDHAGGDDAYGQVCDSRASLSY